MSKSKSNVTAAVHDAVPVQLQPPRSLPALYTKADVPMSQWGTSLDVYTPGGWAKVMRALSPADWMPRDGGEMWLNVADWISHPHEVTDPETGEVSLVTRLVLIGKDGKRAAFHSDFAPRVLAIAILSFPGPWPKEGMPCRCFVDRSKRTGHSEYGMFEFHPELLPAEYYEDKQCDQRVTE